eukprot:5327314-Prymnesium_polylepis.3
MLDYATRPLSAEPVSTKRVGPLGEAIFVGGFDLSLTTESESPDRKPSSVLLGQSAQPFGPLHSSARIRSTGALAVARCTIQEVGLGSLRRGLIFGSGLRHHQRLQDGPHGLADRRRPAVGVD